MFVRLLTASDWLKYTHNLSNLTKLILLYSLLQDDSVGAIIRVVFFLVLIDFRINRSIYNLHNHQYQYGQRFRQAKFLPAQSQPYLTFSQDSPNLFFLPSDNFSKLIHYLRNYKLCLVDQLLCLLSKSEKHQPFHL